MGKKLAWGIIGTGAIARRFAQSLPHSMTGELIAVASRTQEKADKFGAEFKVQNCFGDYQALLNSKDVEAVYISTPHPMHAEWTIRAAEAGKHILCEKPFGVNRAEAMAMIEAARRHDVFLMEAFMYRCHPQTARLVELIREGVIGEVRSIQSTFSFHANVPPEQRLRSNDLAGGGIMDVGCYPVSLCRLIAGAAVGKDFADPVDVKGFARFDPETNVDLNASGILRFPGEILAQVACGVQLTQDNSTRIYGTLGNIVVPWAWVPAVEGGKTSFFVNRQGQPSEEVVTETDLWLYGIEADTCAKYLDARQASSPAMSWADTMGNMTTLDRWRESIGLVYNMEKPEAMLQTVHKRPLAVKKPTRMKYGTIQGVSKQVSRLVMGVDNQMYFPSASVMFDDFFEQGGNCFDSAYVYGGGQLERILGQWIKNRGVREQVVILGKGAHTPFCDPKNLTKQFLESLERLQTDYVDIYMMHRDNLDIPVGEFVEVLNEHLNAGRMRAFGGSNWTLERVRQANEYAAQKGLRGFSAVSNNFSLAEMIEAPWAGCIASSDAHSRKWFETTQIPLMSWSSQARGFFTERANPGSLSDSELVRCWYSEDNFKRQARAKELAAKKGVEPIQIALAYVLCQPFPTHALIGPRSLAEFWSCLGALEIQLSSDELRWLNPDA